MERKLTGVVGQLGSAILRVPEPQIDRNTDRLKLGLRRDLELNAVTGMVALAVLGFLMTIGLGSLTHSLWGTGKPGASVGLFVGIAALAGVVLHWIRSKMIVWLINRLDAGSQVDCPLRESFWTSSSDGDFLLLLAIGLIVALLAYQSLR
jgi:hypothetical protein